MRGLEALYVERDPSKGPVPVRARVRTESPKENVNGGKCTTRNAKDPGLDRADHERNGADRARSVSLAYLFHSGWRRIVLAVHVDGYPGCPVVMPGHGRLLCRDGEAVPGHRQFLLLCGTIFLESREGVALR